MIWVIFKRKCPNLSVVFKKDLFFIHVKIRFKKKYSIIAQFVICQVSICDKDAKDMQSYCVFLNYVVFHT